MQIALYSIRFPFHNIFLHTCIQHHLKGNCTKKDSCLLGKLATLECRLTLITISERSYMNDSFTNTLKPHHRFVYSTVCLLCTPSQCAANTQSHMPNLVRRLSTGYYNTKRVITNKFLSLYDP